MKVTQWEYNMKQKGFFRKFYTMKLKVIKIILVLHATDFCLMAIICIF